MRTLGARARAILVLALLGCALAAPGAAWAQAFAVVGPYTTSQSVTFRNQSDLGLLIAVDVVAVGTGSLTPKVQIRQPISGSGWRDYATFSAITAPTPIGTPNLYVLDPRGGAAGGGAITGKVLQPLPQTDIRVILEKSDASSWVFGGARLRYE